MTTQQHDQLQATIRSAQQTAQDSGHRIAVVDYLYPEHDSERFQYAPVQGIGILHRAEHLALIGLAYPNGSYINCLQILDDAQRL